MLVVGFPALHFRIAVLVELACLLLDLRLSAEQDTLRTHNSGTAIVGERRKNVQDEGVIAVAGRWCLEARTAAEAAEGILVPFFDEDLLLELVLLFLVVRLLLRFEPPELVRKRE